MEELSKKIDYDDLKFFLSLETDFSEFKDHEGFLVKY